MIDDSFITLHIYTNININREHINEILRFLFHKFTNIYHDSATIDTALR